MTRCVVVAGLILSLGAVAPAVAADRQSSSPDCATASECRAQTEQAIEQGDGERAHDLAWRAVQRGPRNDTGLMFLLARAQGASGRPDDALVMLRRLAEMGVANDTSGPEFRRTRDLPGWPAVADLIANLTSAPAERVIPSRIEDTEVPPKPVAPVALVAPIAPRKPSTPSKPAALAKPVAPVKPVEPKPVEPEPVEPIEPVEPVEPAIAGSFSSAAFVPGGFSCDAVSKRFVIGDRLGRKLRIVAEGAANSVDLTGSASGGFSDVAAIDIDTKRGDLWVASAESSGATASLHKLQLVSGRVLSRYDVPAALLPVKPVDLTVTATGAVLMLDAARPRVLVLSPGATAIELLATLDVTEPVSLAAGSRDAFAYVAHRDGIARINLRTRTVAPLSAPARMALAGIGRIRRHDGKRGDELIGVRTERDGARRVVRLTLDSAGQAVTGLKVVGMPLPSDGPPSMTAICGDTMAFLVGGTVTGAEWTFLRIHLAP